MTEVSDRRRPIYLVLLTVLWINLLVLAVKVWAGWATASLSLLAESLHTLIDGSSTVLSLLSTASAYRVSGREVWGHSRREAAGILLLSAFLGFAGFSLLIVSMQQLEAATQGVEVIFPVQINFVLVLLITLVMVVSTGLALFERHQATRLESQALRLNANHVLQDSWLNLIVLVGLIGVWQGYIWLDPLLAIALVLLAVRSLWWMLNRQMPLLVKQTAIAPELLAQITYQIEGVTHCYRIRSKGVVGRQVLVEMHLGIHPEFMPAAHLIAERIEGAIRERYGPVRAKIMIDGDRDLSNQSSQSKSRGNSRI